MNVTKKRLGDCQAVLLFLFLTPLKFDDFGCAIRALIAVTCASIKSTAGKVSEVTSRAVVWSNRRFLHQENQRERREEIRAVYRSERQA